MLGTTSAHAVRSLMKVTPYFNVGSRCGRPNVPTNGHIRSDTDHGLPWGSHRFFQIAAPITHTAGVNLQVLLYHTIGKKSSGSPVKFPVVLQASQRQAVIDYFFRSRTNCFRPYAARRRAVRKVPSTRLPQTRQQCHAGASPAHPEIAATA